jgi:hypothetical protein
MSASNYCLLIFCGCSGAGRKLGRKTIPAQGLSMIAMTKLPGSQSDTDLAHLVSRAVVLSLRFIDGSINPHFRAPEAVMNFLIRYEFFQIELTPAMPSKTAKQIRDGIRLMLSVWP